MQEAATWIQEYQLHLARRLGLHPVTWNDEAAKEVWRSARGELTSEGAADLVAADFLAQADIHTVQALDKDEWVDAAAVHETEIGWTWFKKSGTRYYSFEEAAEMALVLAANVGGKFRVLDRNGNVVPVPYSIQFSTQSPVVHRFVPCRTIADAHREFDAAVTEHARPDHVVLLWDELNNANVKACKVTPDGAFMDVPF